MPMPPELMELYNLYQQELNTRYDYPERSQSSIQYVNLNSKVIELMVSSRNAHIFFKKGGPFSL